MLAALARNLGARAPHDARAAAGALLRTFVTLLVALIGEPLTYRLLKAAWGVSPAQRAAGKSAAVNAGVVIGEARPNKEAHLTDQPRPAAARPGRTSA